MIFFFTFPFFLLNLHQYSIKILKHTPTLSLIVLVILNVTGPSTLRRWIHRKFLLLLYEQCFNKFLYYLCKYMFSLFHLWLVIGLVFYSNCNLSRLTFGIYFPSFWQFCRIYIFFAWHTVKELFICPISIFLFLFFLLHFKNVSHVFWSLFMSLSLSGITVGQRVFHFLSFHACKSRPVFVSITPQSTLVYGLFHFSSLGFRSLEVCTKFKNLPALPRVSSQPSTSKLSRIDELIIGLRPPPLVRRHFLRSPPCSRDVLISHNNCHCKLHLIRAVHRRVSLP